MQKELVHYHKPFSNKTRGVKSSTLISKIDFLPPLFIIGNQGGKKSGVKGRGVKSRGDKSRETEITALLLLHLCYTFVTLFITSLLRILWHFVRFFIFWHFVRARFLTFCPDTGFHIWIISEYLYSCHVDLRHISDWCLFWISRDVPSMTSSKLLLTLNTVPSVDLNDLSCSC